MEVVAGKLLVMIAMIPAVVPARAAAGALGLPVGRAEVTVVLP